LFRRRSFGVQIVEVYRVRLHRGDLLLESVQGVIHKHSIAGAAAVTAAGAIEECTHHRVKSIAEKPEGEFITVRAPMEILNISGLIDGGEPHLALRRQGRIRRVPGRRAAAASTAPN